MVFRGVGGMVRRLKTNVRRTGTSTRTRARTKHEMKRRENSWFVRPGISSQNIVGHVARAYVARRGLQRVPEMSCPKGDRISESRFVRIMPRGPGRSWSCRIRRERSTCEVQPRSRCRLAEKSSLVSALRTRPSAGRYDSWLGRKVA